MKTVTDEMWRDLAREQYANDELQIDPNAVVSISEDNLGVAGAWVAGWVFVGNPNPRCLKCGDEDTPLHPNGRCGDCWPEEPHPDSPSLEDETYVAPHTHGVSVEDY